RSSRFFCYRWCLFSCCFHFFHFRRFFRRRCVLRSYRGSYRSFTFRFSSQSRFPGFFFGLGQVLLFALYFCLFGFQPFLKFGVGGRFVKSALLHTAQQVLFVKHPPVRQDRTGGIRRLCTLIQPI